MALLTAQFGAQWPLLAEFTFNYNDTIAAVASSVNPEAPGLISGGTNGLSSFGSTFTDDPVFETIMLPPNSVVIGGDMVVETAYIGPTAATLAVGDAALATRYLAATSILAAGRTALTLTGFVNAGAANVRMTMSTTVANATAGKVTVRVLYSVRTRVNECQPN